MRKLIIITFILLGFYANGQDPYFPPPQNHFGTTTFGVVSSVAFTDDGEVVYQNFGVSLSAIGPSGVGLYMDAKWGYIDRYNGGIVVRISNMFKIYGAIGMASVPDWCNCWELNCATGLYIITPIRLGFQVGVDYSGFSKYDVEYPLALTCGINFTL